MKCGQSVNRWVFACGSGIGGLVVGAMLGGALPAGAEVRPSAPPQAFKSGGARSALVLQDIKVILERSEKHLLRIEDLLAEGNPPKPQIRRAPLPQ